MLIYLSLKSTAGINGRRLKTEIGLTLGGAGGWFSVGCIDVGDEMCWWQLWDVGDGFGHFRHQRLLSFNISVGQQHPKNVTNIEIPSDEFLESVTNIKSPTSSCHQHLCSRFCEFNLIPVAILPSMLIFSGLIFNFCWTQNFWAFEISKLKIPNIN